MNLSEVNEKLDKAKAAIHECDMHIKAVLLPLFSVVCWLMACEVQRQMFEKDDGK